MSYWIFQSGRQHYDIEKYLVAGRGTNWMVRQGLDRLKAGDIVFFWQVNEKLPLRGWGVLTGSPFRDGDNYKVAVSYKEAFPSSPDIETIANAVGLRNLPVLKTVQGTNFPLTRRQARALSRLLEIRLPYFKWQHTLLAALPVLEIALLITTIALAIHWYLKDLPGLEPLTIICGVILGLLAIVRQKLDA
jgi:hypothetical protein